MDPRAAHRLSSRRRLACSLAPSLAVGVLALVAASACCPAAAAVEAGVAPVPAVVYPATPSARPGRVDVELGRRNVTVSNSVLKAVWTLDKGSMPRLRPVSFSDRVSGVTLDLPLDAFALRLGASEYLRSSTMYSAVRYGGLDASF